ncbi:MAG: hypothetical protein ACLQG5_08870 [Methanobacterium sp.]
MIYTIEARGNVMLEVMESYFDLNSKQMLNEISEALCILYDILKSKNIRYKDLKPTLIPNINKKEVLIVFNTNEIETNFYGSFIFSFILKILDKNSKNSFLSGDYIGKKENQLYLKNILTEHIELNHQFLYSGQYYMIYINNVSDNLFQKLNDNLNTIKGFVGVIDLTYSSLLKEYLSFILIPSFIKIGNIILLQHEDDCDPKENWNTLGYPFEENSFIVKSVPSYLYGVFLTYKIERIVSGADIADIKFSINSIDSNIKKLNNLKINIEDKKLQYLKANKTNSLKRIGLLDTTSINLEKIIKAKIKNNYIFNLDYLEEHDTYKFNLMLEFLSKYNGGIKSFKVLVGLEYNANKEELRLLTMY